MLLVCSADYMYLIQLLNNVKEDYVFVKNIEDRVHCKDEVQVKRDSSFRF